MEKEFVQLITKHQGILLKVCRAYGRSPADAEDLFQEIVLQLWKSYPRFNSNSKITTWMYRIGLNTAITNLRRKEKKSQWQELSTEYLNLANPESERLDVQYDQELQRALDTLNKLDKALVMLYLDDTSYKEMAEIMEMTESYIGVKINRIKKRLKEILKP